jgi:metal transporter CNNM
MNQNIKIFLLISLLSCTAYGQNLTSCAPPVEEESSFAVPAPFSYILILLLVCLSALFSGLTLGLLGLDVIGLEIIMGGDSPDLIRCAKAIYPVRKKGNFLLCTLLLGNVATNALLSILMADMTSGLVGFLVSTFVIVIFGEIIPQATCSRHALQIGRRSLPLVKVFMTLLSPMAYPLSVALDYMLGEEIGTVHTRTELLTMLRIHERHEQLDNDTVNVMTGAINYRDKLVSEVVSSSIIKEDGGV